ncbi:glycosyltransferase involved in cell wall biosynthesis [Arthrobacter sp. UYEF6]
MAEPVVAIAHDYLTQKGGAERVVLAMHRAFPDATIYTTLYDPDRTFPEFANAKIVTSPLNRIAMLRKDHRLALPFLAFASSALKVPGDVVVMSSTGWAHGFTARGRRYVYCHSPARWLYLTDQYLGKSAWSSPTGWALAVLRPFLTLWDKRAAALGDVYVGNSTVVQKRLHDVYGKRVDIFHPPHSVSIDGPREPIDGLDDFIGHGGHFLVVSRLLPYKNVDKAIEAFRGLDKRLLIIGAGPLVDELRALCPDNVRMASNISDQQMRWAYASCQAVIAPSHEDFGITPLEGGAWGKPTLALRAGGYLDTIEDGVTGAFFEEPTSACICEAVQDFQSDSWDPETIQAHVEKFSEERFRNRLREEVFALADS